MANVLHTLIRAVKVNVQRIAADADRRNMWRVDAPFVRHKSLLIKSAAVMLLLGLSKFLFGTPADHQASELLGEWQGASLCTDRVVAPACKDEVVIYKFTDGAQAGTVHWQADKVVNGERQNMGEFDLSYDRDDLCWRAEYKSARAHVVFCLNVKGSELTGSGWVLPGKRVVRKIAARRK